MVTSCETPVIFTEDHLVCAVPNHDCCEYMINKWPTIKVTSRCIDAIVASGTTDHKLLTLFINHGAKPTENHICHFSNNKEAFAAILNTGVQITDNCINSFLSKRPSVLDVKEFISKGASINVSHLNYMLTRFASTFYSSQGRENANIIESTILMIETQGVIPTTESLNIYLKKPESTTHALPVSSFLPPGKVFDVRAYFDNCICQYNTMMNLTMYFIDRGAVPDTVSLEHICSANNYPAFKTCTEKYKLIPTKVHLDIVVRHSKSNNEQMLADILKYRIMPDKTTFDNLVSSWISHNQKQDIAKLELLINCGLLFTVDMLERVFAKGYNIDNVERFGIEYDEKFYWLCYRYNKLVPEYCDKFTMRKEVVALRSMFSTMDIPMLKSYMIANGLKPDRYCMENACKNNITVLTWLINDCGCSPTAYCFSLVNSTYYAAKSQLLRDSYNKANGIDHVYMSTVFDVDLSDKQESQAAIIDDGSDQNLDNDDSDSDQDIDDIDDIETADTTSKIAEPSTKLARESN